MKLAKFFIRLVIYASTLVGVIAVVAYDASVNNFTQSTYLEDNTLTEWVQEGLLLLMVTISAVCAKKFVVNHHVNVMLAVVAALSLVREFNNHLGDGWKVGVLLILIPAGWYFYSNFRAFRQQLIAVAETYAFAIVVIGGLILHVFSRLYGHKTMWTNILGDNYLRTVSRVAEESIELLAYSIILIGITELYRQTKMLDMELRQDRVLLK